MNKHDCKDFLVEHFDMIRIKKDLGYSFTNELLGLSIENKSDKDVVIFVLPDDE
jgi:hypothetical protein